MQSYDLAVLFGGISNENEISIITGTMVCNIAKKGGLTVLPIFISRRGEMFAGEILCDINSFKAGGYKKADRAAVCDGGVIFLNAKGKFKGRAGISCAINCCHGGVGEGGGACGLFALNNIPLCSAGLFESSAFMNKYFTKLVLTSLGVNVAPYVYLRDMGGAIAAAENIGYPLIVKPANLGSSIGVKKVNGKDELIFALEAAFTLDSGVLLESYLYPRREINCAAYFANDRVTVSECEEAVTKGELLSYEDKYMGEGRSVFPADIERADAAQIKSITEFVYKSLDMRGVVRFDYIMANGQIYLSEINTVPGSLANYLLSPSYDEFFKVLQELIAQAVADKNSAGKKLIINTGIINNLSSNACKIK